MTLRSLLLAGLSLAVASPVAAQTAHWGAPLPETATSRIFAPIVLDGTAEAAALRQADYIQQEYLLSGTGNIYAEGPQGGPIHVAQQGIAYTTRVVILRPRDSRKFNGIVHLAFQHPSLAGTQWGRIDSLVLRTGAAYAVVINGGDAPSRKLGKPGWPVSAPLLPQWYDGARYKAFYVPEDDGLRWDIMGQSASLLRDPGTTGPLAGLRVRHVYLSGWSFLGSTIRSWINFGFHDRYRRKDGSPVIDGYLIGISAGSVEAGHVPLSSGGAAVDHRRDMLRSIDVPVIELTSSMEAITNVFPQTPDSDAVKGGHRIYELGGVSHLDSGISGQVRPSTVQLLARRHPSVDMPPACSVEDTDVPMRDVAQAALANIDRWVTTGQAPPRAARMQVEGKDYVRDAFGNPLGGVRAAQLDVPLVTYAEAPAAACGGVVPRRNLKRLPVDPALLATTYPGDKADYLARFDARLAALVRDGWLLAPDAAQERLRARRYADQAFPVGRGAHPATAQGKTAAGATWAAEVPANWNGTLLLWSRGYSATLSAPETAPANARQLLLDKGYALLASDYGAAGWALEQAVPAQRAALDGFAATYGAPRQTIAWGQSMGGLVTTALAEHAAPRLDGAMAFCPSIGGAVGMMNMALDGAFAFRTLAAPQVQLTGITDDMANGRRAQDALTAAMATPQGRARVALAGVLGGLPGWTRRDHAQPTADDVDAQADEIGAALVGGVFLPRADQEARAGGVFSWNKGVDYAAQLRLSGRRAFVEALYRKAGLDLDADLARLKAAPRVAAKPAAVSYMMAHYTPTARPLVPLLSVQAVGDGATSPSLQRAYVEAADPAHVAALWLNAAGHCGFSGAAMVTALRHLEQRLDGQGWGNPPAGTMAYTPPPMLRPCLRGRVCR